MTKPISALLPYFGADRMVAQQISDAIGPVRWLGIPCGGGMSILKCVKASSIVVGDKHRMVINLARAVADEQIRTELIAWLADTPFHPDSLARAQCYCQARIDGPPSDADPDIELAYQYFIAAWMGRSGMAGTEDEFKGKIATRWTSSGGDSNTRFRSAAAALEEFAVVMQRCNFVVCDIFDFLANVRDEKKHALYIDVPWPGDGASYRHKFSTSQQDQLAEAVAKYHKTRVVLRFGVHPETEQRYPKELWTRLPVTSRTQGNNDKAEMLLTNAHRLQD